MDRSGKRLENRKRTWQYLRFMAERTACVCVFAPMFTPENQKDGYIQRIKAIDARLLRRFFCIYLMGDHPELEAEQILRYDRRHVFIQFNSADPEQRERVLSLVSAARRALIHSVYRFMAGYVAPEMRQVLDMEGVELYWDVHGAVPEECRLNGDPGIAAVAEEIEKRLYCKAKLILCVSRAMVRHLRDKYGQAPGQVLLLPIIPETLKTAPSAPPPREQEKPAAVYSGGMQSWQCVPDMLTLISETADRYQWRLFVPDLSELRRLWGDRPGWEALRAASLSPEDMAREYAQCQYGLLLREDIAVNRVACPTKLVEYICHGIVPVLRSPHVGDFVELGMGYIPEEDFRAGKLPSESARRDMAAQNKKVLDLLQEEYQTGSALARKALAGGSFRIQ